MKVCVVTECKERDLIPKASQHIHRFTPQPDFFSGTIVEHRLDIVNRPLQSPSQEKFRQISQFFHSYDQVYFVDYKHFHSEHSNILENPTDQIILYADESQRPFSQQWFGKKQVDYLILPFFWGGPVSRLQSFVDSCQKQVQTLLQFEKHMQNDQEVLTRCSIFFEVDLRKVSGPGFHVRNLSNNQAKFDYVIYGKTANNVFSIGQRVENDLAKQQKIVRQPENHAGCLQEYTITIQNPKTQKCMVFSYWDKPDIIFGKGWNSDLVRIIASSAGSTMENLKNLQKKRVHWIPFTQCLFNQNQDSLTFKEFSKKHRNQTLFFRGQTCALDIHQNHRYNLHRMRPDMVTDQRVSQSEQLKELNDNQICLSLNGWGEICQRDLEIMAVGSVLFRPVLENRKAFDDPLLEGVHQIGFHRYADAKVQLQEIDQKFALAKKNPNLQSIAKAGHEWYLRNGTLEANTNIVVNLFLKQKHVLD